MHGIADFVHLHVHTEFSLLDGMIRIEDLVKQAEAYQMPAVAMTDHGSLFGAVKFYNQVRERGMKPIIGCEVYVAPNRRTDRDQVGHHLVLLCKNYKGYQNLCQLVSAGYLEGFYYKPRIDKELLAERNEGLIALSACLKGEVPAALLEDDQERAVKAAGFFKEVFDNNRFYLELQENGIKDQRRVNRELLALGKRLELPVVATNDCHYLSRDLAEAHEVLLCLQTGKTLEDKTRMKMATEEFYFRSPGEMKEKFAELPEAIANTLEIANRCNLDWPLGIHHFPRFVTPGEVALDQHLTDQVRAGFERRLPEIKLSDPNHETRREEYKKRLDYELKVIIDMGFAGYFLIVAEFVNWAKARGIPVGPGRGSAAGSLISYCLGVTDLNPLAYGLLFERFLNPERKDLPDIDIDFCQERRDEVIKHVTELYGGSDYVAQIITFGTLRAKAVVRDVGRALGMAYGDVDRIAKLIPDNPKVKLKDALEQEPRLAERRDQDPNVQKLLTLAGHLEGMARHASTHAAGVVISDRPLTDYLPLYKDQKSEAVVSQFDKDSVEKVGLIKFDLLGLKTLTQIKNCVDLVRTNRGVELDMSRLAMDDAGAFGLLSRGDTGGIFQLESSGMKEILVRLTPNRLEELIAVVALYRPGPMAYVDEFIERKHGRRKIEYPLRRMEEPLKETYGVICYQEQVMELAVKLAGYTLGEADNLRKAMGKKQAELMAAQQEKFIAGAIKNKITEDKAKTIFKDLAAFAGYGFNKSHAAVYAYVAYQTAYLKAHYPVEFMASLLTMDMDKADKTNKYLRECEEKKIPVDPPHVNHSDWQFIAIGDRIRFGLGAVKGVGRGAVEAIVEARKTGEFHSLFEFCERIDHGRVNRRALEGMIKGGAFDGLGPDRARMLAAIESALEASRAAQKERESGQSSLFEILGDDERREVMVESYPEAPPWTSTELLTHEKEALGLYLTGHPLARFEEMMTTYGVTDTASVQFRANGEEIIVGGVVTNRKEITTKKKGKKERMAFITITDLKGSLETVVFASVYREALEYLEREDLPLLIRGRVEISEDKVKLLAGEIFPLEEAPDKLSLTTHLTIRRQSITPEHIERMGKLLAGRRGRSKVVVHVVIPNQSETVISLPHQYWIHPEQELIEAIEELLGEGTVRLTAA